MKNKIATTQKADAEFNLDIICASSLNAVDTHIILELVLISICTYLHLLSSCEITLSKLKHI